MRNIFFRLGLLSALWGASVIGAPPQGGAGESWLSYGQKALDEYKAKNYPAFLDAAQKAFRLGPPRQPHLMYYLARAYSLNGKTAEASKLLGELADMGLGVDAAESDDFKPLRAADGWADLSKKIAAARAPLVRSRTEFVIREPDLLPEGIAYDPKHRTFYLGSIYKSKIISVDAAGRKKEFKATGQDGLLSVLGMNVDARRRLLWVCNNTRDGVAFVHKYDLDSGRLIKKYALDERPRQHQANDITFNSRGDAYVTDSAGSAVYEIPAGADEMRLLAKLEEGVYPNGIALSADEKRLYVANFAGIALIDIGTKTRGGLAHAANVALTGADGLYLYGDSLVAVQNSNPSPDRVVRLFLNAGGDRVERARVIESNHPLYALPTTGVIVGDDFFYVANTQINNLAAGGKLSPDARLRDPVLLKVSLN